MWNSAIDSTIQQHHIDVISALSTPQCLSFKPLGGAYAVARLLMDEVPALAGVPAVTTQDLLDGVHADTCALITVTAATDGNHGRSVAWGAQLFGCRCVIFINEAVSAGREAAIAAFGTMFTLAYWMKYSVWYKVLELKEEKARGQFRPGAELRGDVVLM